MSKLGHAQYPKRETAFPGQCANSKLTLVLFCGGTGSSVLRRALSLMECKPKREHSLHVIPVDSNLRPHAFRRPMFSYAAHARALMNCRAPELFPIAKFNKKMDRAFFEEIRSYVFHLLHGVSLRIEGSPFTHGKLALVRSTLHESTQSPWRSEDPTRGISSLIYPYSTTCKGSFGMPAVGELLCISRGKSHSISLDVQSLRFHDAQECVCNSDTSLFATSHNHFHGCTVAFSNSIDAKLLSRKTQVGCFIMCA